MTGRVIPVDLVNHLRGAATTTCRLFKVMAVDDAPFGLTSHDTDITYDGLTYKAKRGYNPNAIEASADMSVDNSDMRVLLAEFVFDGFTADAIARGVYDDARFTEYLVNYLDLAAGHVILNSGFIGKVRVVDGLLCFPEMRSLTQTLKQKSVIEKGSNNCRAAFGDERCKIDTDPLWSNRTVTLVGAETDRTFTVGGTSPADDAWKPGLFEFFTGDNAGRTYEIETNTAGAITLLIPTEKPIQVGDTGRVRPDCTKLWDGPNSCNTYNNRLNFRGEPWRPVADTASLMVPG